ncbi:SusC/RagA family TonB-linked outer membrane protein [Niabella ginsengisoli]|uniref:TonB-dependent receptor n=1 Tax=Niabella ginsengisoli TaxID=522298 RepID=A0ABS9SEU5_9BACT|nr:SusC/RagA family TonB-linked outer membrane protein [Niabella ginsengisoli]MCH5596879.1 TonB-dependent receptor [Niabella ginsengisoli]
MDYRIAQGDEADPAKITDYLSLIEANNYKAGKTVDWFKELIKPALFSDYNASISGQANKTNYFLSGGYLTQKGIVDYDDFKRISVRLNVSNKITNWLAINVKSTFTSMDYSGQPYGKLNQLHGLSPYSNIYEDGASSGKYAYYPMEDPYFRNPYLQKDIIDEDIRTSLWGAVSTIIDVPFVKGLKLTSNYSINHRQNDQNNFENSYLDPVQNGFASKKNEQFLSWLFDNIVSYNKTFNGVHDLSLTGLVSREFYKASNTLATANNFFNQATGFYALELGEVQKNSSGYADQNQTAVMGRINYGYDNRYSITGTVRRDGYSAFAEGNKYATFLSGGIAWTVSEEAFMKDITWMDNLKIRLSYGQNGNQAIDRYSTLAKISNAKQYIFGDGGTSQVGAEVTGIANNSLGWEKTSSYNLGIDFSIFKNRLSGNIDLYSSQTTDLLLKRDLQNFTGYADVLTNIGQTANKGIEIALNGDIVRSGNIVWNMAGTFALNRNKITKLVGADNDGDGKEDDNIASSWFIGEPLGVIYGYGINGIHQTGEENIPAGYAPGDFRIVDYDGDGELSANDRHILGYSTPNYRFSITNTFSYKNWALFARINSIQGGNGYYLGNNIAMHNPNNNFASWTERFSFTQMDYWTPDNPSNTAARINYTAPRGHAYLEDRSFIRLQDVTLSYSLNQQLLDKYKIKGLRIFASGTNLYTWTKWSGYDPEPEGDGYKGTTIGHFPMLRTYTVGLDFKF